VLVDEPGSDATLELLAGSRVVTSRITEVELRRMLVRRGLSDGAARVSAVLAAVALLNVDGPVLRAAAALPGAHLRTLDALHLASALELGDDLGALVTHDARLAEAATAAGLQVLTPT
jgi:hypothetical protein